MGHWWMHSGEDGKSSFQDFNGKNLEAPGENMSHLSKAILKRTWAIGSYQSSDLLMMEKRIKSNINKQIDTENATS